MDESRNRTTAVPIVDGLCSVEDETLIGSTCASCAFVTFPRSTGCPRWGADQLDDTLLHDAGTLWTWTSQEFRPVAPPYTGADTAEQFERYYVGYVALPGQTRVEARLVNVGPDGTRIGDRYRFTIHPFGPDGNGNERLIYAFEPCTDAAPATQETSHG